MKNTKYYTSSEQFRNLIEGNMDTTNTHIHDTLFLLGTYTSIKVAGLDYFYAMEHI